MRTYNCDPGTEVSGATLSSLIQNVNSTDIAPFLRRYSLEYIDAADWYSSEIFLDFLNEMIHHPNTMYNLVAIGISIAEVAIMPAELEHATFEEIVRSWNAHYQANFRNGYVGRKTAIQVDHNRYKVILDQTILPDDLEYGVLYGFAKRFLPHGTPFSVWFDEDLPRLDEGGAQTVLHVLWE
jgi:hypothetical protein